MAALRNHHSLRSVAGHRKFHTLTDLNRLTSARFAACRGRHQPSGDSVLRQFAGKVLDLPICAVCDCPYNFPPLKRWGEQPL